MAGTPVRALWTGRADGDLRLLAAAPPPAPAGSPLWRLRQVHGAGIVVVGGPAVAGSTPWAAGPAGAAPEGDALVSADGDSALAVLVADCAPVALGSPEGVRAAVHAGWRGLRAGVLEAAAAVVRSLGATEVVAGRGPCIGPCCYEFSADGIDEMGALCGTAVGARSTRGRPSLDLPKAVAALLARAGVRLVEAAGTCTACSPEYFSHRASGDAARQALVVWRDG